MQARLLSHPTHARATRRPLAELAASVATWLRHHAQRRELMRLDDGMLKDIGLTRADVDRESHRPFWEPVDHAALEAARRRSGPRLGR